MKKIFVIVTMLVMLAAVGAGTAYGESKELQTLLARPQELTQANNRAVAVVTVGDMITLKLGEAPPEWEVSFTGDPVLSPVMTFAPVRGAQGVWTARTPGTTVISAVGYFPCQRQQPACKIASPFYTVTLVVQPERTGAGQFQIAQGAFLENSRTYVPAADLARALGAEYSEQGGQAVLKAGGATVTLNAGSKEMSVGSAMIAMDVAPVVRDGVLHLPMRWVSEALGYRVSWDGSTWTASFSGH